MIPALIGQLSSFPPESQSKGSPWFELWSRLCHQGDVYSASFAAVPHILAIADSSPGRTSLSFFLLPAAIELARHRHGTEVPDDVLPDYRTAISQIPHIAAKAASGTWSTDYCQAVLAAIAASRAQYELASLLTTLESSEIREVREWYQSR